LNLSVSDIAMAFQGLVSVYLMVFGPSHPLAPSFKTMDSTATISAWSAEAIRRGGSQHRAARLVLARLNTCFTLWQAATVATLVDRLTEAMQVPVGRARGVASGAVSIGQPAVQDFYKDYIIHSVFDPSALDSTLPPALPPPTHLPFLDSSPGTLNAPLGSEVPSWVTNMWSGPARAGRVKAALACEPRFAMLRTAGSPWCEHMWSTAGKCSFLATCPNFHQEPSAGVVSKYAPGSTPGSPAPGGKRRN